MTAKPGNWCDWDPLRGGTQGHALVQQRFPEAMSQITETSSPKGQQQAHPARRIEGCDVIIERGLH